MSKHCYTRDKNVFFVCLDFLRSERRDSSSSRRFASLSSSSFSLASSKNFDPSATWMLLLLLLSLLLLMFLLLLSRVFSLAESSGKRRGRRALPSLALPLPAAERLAPLRRHRRHPPVQLDEVPGFAFTGQQLQLPLEDFRVGAPRDPGDGLHDVGVVEQRDQPRVGGDGRQGGRRRRQGPGIRECFEALGGDSEGCGDLGAGGRGRRRRGRARERRRLQLLLHRRRRRRHRRRLSCCQLRRSSSAALLVVVVVAALFCHDNARLCFVFLHLVCGVFRNKRGTLRRSCCFRLLAFFPLAEVKKKLKTQKPRSLFFSKKKTQNTLFKASPPWRSPTRSPARSLPRRRPGPRPAS